MESSLSLPMNLSRRDILAILNCSILNVLIFFFSAFKFHSSFVSLIFIPWYCLLCGSILIWLFLFLVILQFKFKLPSLEFLNKYSSL